MDRDRRFGQEPGFKSRQQFDAGAQRPRSVPDFIVGSNGMLIFPGESRGRSEPVKGTGRARRITNRNNRKR